MAFDVREYAKNRKQNEENGNTDSQKSFSVQDYVKQRNLPKVGEYLTSSLKSWNEKNSSLFTDFQSRFGSENTAYRADASDWYKDFKTRRNELQTEADEIKSWIESYKGYLDEDFVSSVMEAFDTNITNYGDMTNYARDDKKYWSQWETEDAYNEYLKQQEDYNKMLEADLGDLKYEIDYWEERLAPYTSEIPSYGRNDSEMVSTPQDKAAILQQRRQDFYMANAMSLDDAEAMLAEKKRYYNEVERVQKANELASVANPESVNYDPAFAEKSQYKSTASDSWHKGLTTDYGMGYEDLTHEFINGDDDFRSEVLRKYDTWHSDLTVFDTGVKSKYETAGYEHMTDDEIAIYNYYYNTEGKDKAQEYLDSIEESLHYRLGSEIAEGKQGIVSQYLFAVEAGLDQFASGVESLFSDKDYIPPSATQVASGIIREDLADSGAKLPDWLGGASLGQVGYDALNTTSNMLPSILASTGANAILPGSGAVVGARLMGTSAAGHGRAEMLNLGYSNEQATTYGLMVGAAEAGMEYLLGGISKLGGKASGGLTEFALSKVDNAFARTAIKIGGSMASEAFEEGLQTVIEPWLKEIATGVDWDAPNIDEVLYSSLLGALSAFGLEGAGVVAGEVGTYQSGKTIRNTNGGVGKLQEIGSTFSADSVAYKIASKVDATTDAYTIGRLLSEVGGTISEQNVTDIANGLIAKGIDSTTANKLAKQYQAILNSEMNITDEQVKILENLSPLADVLRKNIIGANTTVYQRTRAYSDLMGLANEVTNDKKGVSTAESTTTQKSTSNVFEQNAMNAEVQKIASEVALGSRTSAAGQAVKKVVDSASSAAEAKLGVKGRYSSSDTGATRLANNNQKINIVGVASISDGTMKLKLDDGSVVSANEINFSSSNEALVYEAVTNMGVNPTTAWEILKGYNPKSGQSGTIYAMGALEAYTYGHNGIKVDGMSKDGFSALLSPTQKNTANKLGDIDARAKVEAQQKTIDKAVKSVRDEAKSKHKAIPKRKGGVVLEGVTATLTDLQESQIDVLGKMAEGLGVTFHIFESKPDAEGKRYYTMPDGKITSANGWYETKTGEIWIDLHAGNSYKGTMIFTAAHELTHFIKQWSPDKFKAFADFLFEQYGKKGQDVNQLIRNQIQKAANNGRSISWDDAYEEVVADSCETFLRDSKAAEKIAALREKDVSLANKIKSFLGQMLAKMRKVMANLIPDTDEGKMVAEMTDSIQKLYDLWTDALADAGEAYSTLADIDLDTDSVAPMLSERTWTASEYVTEREETAKKISKALGVDIKTAYKYIDDINSVARLIADDRARLDYEPNLDDHATVLKPNSEYKYSVDMSTLCAKRLLFTGTFDAIQRALPNTVFDSEDIVALREMMQDRGYEVACGICYVESTRREIGRITQDFINSYIESQKTGKPMTRINSEGKAVELKKTKDQMDSTADKSTDKFFATKDYTPTLADLNTTDIDLVKRDHPLVYEAYLNFMNARGQAKPKLLETRAEYKGEILKHFKSKSAVNARNNSGGLRLQSFSDFEVPHLIDMMQIVMDMSRVGLKSQAYTKVPAFAEVFGNTGVKINLSLIAKGDGLDANGNLVFDDVEGINHNEAFKLRDKYSKNVGTILVGKTDAHIIAAMADPRIDYIIPFHKSSWKESLYDALGLTGYADYTDFQNEKPLDKDRKIKNFDPSEYWDFSKSGDENAQIYLEKCREDGRIPKFPQFQGYPGYWKLLIDFKMYDNDGVGSPQEVVRPTFNTEASERILSEYKGGHKSFPVAKDVVEDFVREHKITNKAPTSNPDIRYSVREIVGDSGKNYGVGVYLDSNLLTALTEDERIEMVKERVKELGGSTFTAYDSNHNAVDVHIVESSRRFRNKNGRKVRVYDHMLGYLQNEVKQEAVVLVDELISTSVFDRKETSAYSHDWLDNNGANDWDSWTTYLQDKENTVWEATLKIANSTSGEKILYEIYPIKMVEQSGKPNTSTTAPIITQPDGVVNSGNEKNSLRNVEPIETADYVKMYHHFGSTKNYDVAGYILGNGIMLDFSGKHWGDDYSTSRQVDHRDIQEVLGNRGSNNGVNAMIDMIGNGNIRLMPEVGGINLAVKPNATQMAQLRGYINHFKGEVEIDIDEVGGDTIHSFRYTRGTSSTKVLADIKAYFDEGIVPEQKDEGETDIRQFLYSDRVTDKKTRDFLDEQIAKGEYDAETNPDGGYYVTYKSMSFWGYDDEGNAILRSPMAEYVDGKLSGAYLIPKDKNKRIWYQATETIDENTGLPSGLLVKVKAPGKKNPNKLTDQYLPASENRHLIKDDWSNLYFNLKKKIFKNGKWEDSDVPARYNPYEHSSNSMLNDQFSVAYLRDNLVTVKMYVPVSEDNGTYRAKWSKDPTGWADWKTGVVAGKIGKQKNLKRRLYLSRYATPVEIVPDSEVAQAYKGYLEGTDVAIPDNVVPPNLLKELKKIGVPIEESGKVMYSDRSPSSVSTRSLLANALETTAQNDIERNKLAQYKSKIDLIESEHEKLTKLNAQIKELSFAKGKRDSKAIKALQFEANQTANRINTYDRQLLNLESTTALKNVLNREKELARRKEAQKGKEALAKYKEKAAKTQRELMDKNTESRKKAIESRNKTKMRDDVKKVVGDLKELLFTESKDKHVPIGLQKPVAEALDIINMDTVGADERVANYDAMIAKANDPDIIAELKKSRDRIALQGENLSDKLTALKLAYAEIKNSDDPLVRDSHNEAIEDLIANTAEKVGNTSLRDMSYEQLEAVYDMYKAILATVRNANKLFKATKQETITENSELVKREVRSAGGHRDRVLKATKFLKKFGWNMLKPIYAMKLIGSDTLTNLYENVRKGEDTWAVDVNEAKDFFKETAKKYEYNVWDFEKQYKFADSAGHAFSLTLDQIMSLYAYSKRNQADKHLEFGGFIFDDSIEVTKKNKLGIPMKYEVNDANPYRLKKEDLAKIIDLLESQMPNVKAFVDEMQAYLSDVMGAKGNEVSLAMYDIKLYKEQNYFPLKTAKYFREFDPEKNGTPKIKNSGFSKKTVPQAGNPIILSNFMDVWANHVNDMSMYHAFVLPLEDFMRVYNYSSTAGGYDSVQQYIKNAYGSQANTYIETLMNDLNGGARTDPATDLIGKGMSLFKKAAVFASASVVIQQPSAIARALAYIDAKYFVDKPEATKHKETWAEVKKYAPVAIIKEMGYFDTNMGRSTVDWIKEEKTWRDKVDDVASKAPALADELAWCAIWKAVKREVADTTNLKVGSEAFLKKAGERFTEVVTKTQVYDSVLSRSALMRSKDSGAKMVTAFMAEPTTSLNMVVDAIIEGKRGNKKFAGKVVGAVATSIILNSILVSLVTAARDDDEDETYLEKYLGSLTAELLDGFNPITYIPIFKDIWSVAQGYDVERSDMSIWSDFIQSIDNLFNDNKSGFEKTEGVVGSIASFFGLPAKNLMRDARAMYNLVSTVMRGTPTTWAGVGDAVGGAVKDTIPFYSKIEKLVGADESKSDKLYDAIMSGDQKQIDRVKAQYKDDKAVETAIRQALRENDPRIKEAAQARYDGDIEEYKRIAKDIISEGNFSQDTVVAAINAEINAIKKGETSEEEPSSDIEKVTSIYKASDINSAFESGDTDAALEVIEDLINTKVENYLAEAKAEAEESGKRFNERTARKEAESKAKSSIRSSMTSYWKPLYKAAYNAKDTDEQERIKRILKDSGMYGNASEVIKTIREWRSERD